MAIDKNKIIEAATKYVQKGQYDKAIKEYGKLLEADPKDARIQQKLGELYQKKGENGLAADCFLKVAESYSADGFFLKAVAVYKQVLKLNPNLVDVNIRLAELHQQLGLMSDAMAQYQLVVNHYDKVGDTRASLDTLRKMVELDPDNIASRIKLAELYAREGLNPEAIGEFQHAAEYLKRNNRVDDYIKVAERLVFLDPGNLELTRELAAIYLAKQDTKRALAKLQLCFKADPKDVETLSMLAQAFKDLGQVSKTVSVYKELARIYDDQDRVDDERAVWKKIYEIAPDDPDARARLAPKQAVAAAVPAAPGPMAAPAARETAAAPAVAPQAAPASAGKPSPEAISKLLTETDVYVKYGLHEKAIEHLKKVFAIDPQSVEGHEKAFALNSATGNYAAANENLVLAVRFAIARQDLDRARSNLQTLCEKDPAHAAIPAFLEAVGGLAPVEEIAEIEEDAILVEAADEEIEVAPEPPQVDLSHAGSQDAAEESLVEASVDEDDAALAAAVESYDDQEIVSDSEEELIAAPSDDEMAINAALNYEDLVEPAAEDLVEDLSAGYGEPSIEGFAADEVPFAADAGGETAQPFESGDGYDDFDPDRDPQEEATRVAFLPSLMAEQAGNAGPVPETANWENEEGNEEVTSVLPTIQDEELIAEPLAEEFVDEVAEPDADEFMDEFAEPADESFSDEAPADPAASEIDFSVVSADDSLVDDGSDDFPVDPQLEDPISELGAEPSTEGFVEELADPEDEVVDQAEPASSLPADEPLAEELLADEPSAEELPSDDPVAAADEEGEQPTPPPEEPVEAAAEDEEPGGDELDEAAFFIEQGVLDEAREILETVMLAYPNSARASQLMNALEAKERGEDPASDETPTASPAEDSEPQEPPAFSAEDIAFDLASELASDDLAETEGEASSDDFQVSFEDVFSEFKKGVQKIVRPEDVDTHYDLGIAYKEMGLIDDAIGEFEQALSAAIGKRKEVESLTMIGLCRLEREQFAEAVDAFARGLKSTALTPDSGQALHFEIGVALERLGDLPKALRHLMTVEKRDPKYRDVHSIAERLRAQGVQPAAEEVAPAVSPAPVKRTATNGGSAGTNAARKPSAAAPVDHPDKAKKSSKIGYV